MVKAPGSQNGQQSSPPPEVSLQGRNRLPSGKSVVVRVLRGNLPWTLVVVLLFGMACFLGGVWAGTSGQYREFVTWSTTQLSAESRLRNVLLAADFSERPLLGERVSRLELALTEELETMQAHYADVLERYNSQAQGLLAVRSQIPVTRESCNTASQQANQAANHSYQTGQNFSKMENYWLGALRACMADFATAEEAVPIVESDSRAPETE